MRWLQLRRHAWAGISETPNVSGALMIAPSDGNDAGQTRGPSRSSIPLELERGLLLIELDADECPPRPMLRGMG